MAMVLFYNSSIYHKAEPTLAKLHKLGTVSPITTFSGVIERSIVLRNDDEGRS